MLVAVNPISSMEISPSHTTRFFERNQQCLNYQTTATLGKKRPAIHVEEQVASRTLQVLSFRPAAELSPAGMSEPTTVSRSSSTGGYSRRSQQKHCKQTRPRTRSRPLPLLKRSIHTCRRRLRCLAGSGSNPSTGALVRTQPKVTGEVSTMTAADQPPRAATFTQGISK